MKARDDQGDEGEVCQGIGDSLQYRILNTINISITPVFILNSRYYLKFFVNIH